MKPFTERNPTVVGAIGIAVIAAVLVIAPRYDELPLVSDSNTYGAYFADAAGLKSDARVEVSGFKTGQVSHITLDGAKVLVKFKLPRNIRLGDRTEAAIKNETLLGTKIVQVTPKGKGALAQYIPLERTTSPYQLPDALGDLTNTISGLKTDQLSSSLTTLSQTFQNTPAEFRAAVEQVTRIARTLDNRDDQLRNLLRNANTVTTVLAHRTDQIVNLVKNSNDLLAELRTQGRALDKIATHLSTLSQQLSNVVADNKDQLRPALDKLNAVLAIVDNHKAQLQKSIKLLNSYAMSLGESVSSGPFFHAYLANLLPGQFVQPYIDAAFSDLGLDPNVLLPSQRIDPPVGQPATPPLPVPYPRTGQGGPPRRSLPDAITGNPNDHGCGGPGMPLPGPGCYPAREPGPAPAPGGPPPGPPAPMPPGVVYSAPPTPDPMYRPAPGEAPPAGTPSARSGQ